MKHRLILCPVLAGIWLLWSGHIDPFLLLLGCCSIALSLLISHRMQIIDEERTLAGMGVRVISYAIWLTKKVVEANLEVTRLILDPKLPIHPRMVCVSAKQRTELGKVIFANSITLTPGTVSVDLQQDRVWVHALSVRGAEEDLSGEMHQRVCNLER